jgi:histidine triad (HIT) family protein
VATWDEAIAFVPLNPVTPGHLLVIPKRHVADVTENPTVSAAVMCAAAELATPPCNIITSAGREATQTVFHLHLHVVPRRAGDGLALPWTDRQTASSNPFAVDDKCGACGTPLTTCLSTREAFNERCCGRCQMRDTHGGVDA